MYVWFFGEVELEIHITKVSRPLDLFMCLALSSYVLVSGNEVQARLRTKTLLLIII